MIVNVDPEDRTWNTHVHGFLAMLTKSKFKASGIHSTLRYELSGTNSKEAGDLSLLQRESTSTMVTIMALRLQPIVARMQQLLHGDDKPRKLDVQKTRMLLSRVHKDILSLRLLVCSHFDFAAIRALSIACICLLLPSGCFLQSGERLYTSTKECKRLNDVKEREAAEICVWTKETLERSSNSRPDVDNEYKAANVLSAIWPLFAATRASDAAKCENGVEQKLLAHIGEAFSIPKAMHLV